MMLNVLRHFYSTVFPKPANEQYTNKEVVIKVFIWAVLIAGLVFVIIRMIYLYPQPVEDLTYGEGVFIS